MKNSLAAVWQRKKHWIVEMSLVVMIFILSAAVLFDRFSGQKMLIVDNGWHTLILPYAGMILGILPFFFLLVQAVLVCFYKPVTEWKDGMPLPGCTVIVPAYNEGEHVAYTLRSLLKSDYPKDKLEIIAVNDGSKDDTWNWIKLAAGESDGLIKAINLEKNGGKKHALYRGFHEAKHELVLTIDSDSIVRPDTISKLILPFSDPKVAVSAGIVRVRNLNQGFIPRILDVCFVFSCDFMRSAQSVIGAVLCSPGAISGYRKSALLPLLDEWLNQTFLGEPSNIGEDRALTSLLLRNGYHTVLQSNALVDTCVPTDYPQLCRTLIRWTRGDVREGLLMIKHFFRKFDLTDMRRTVLQFNLFCQLFGLLMAFLIVPCMLYTFIAYSHNLPFIISYTFVTTWMWATIPAVLYARRETPLKAIWAFIYSTFSLLALSWVCIYSWFTMKNSNWLTRDISSKENETDVGDGTLNYNSGQCQRPPR